MILLRDKIQLDRAGGPGRFFRLKNGIALVLLLGPAAGLWATGLWADERVDFDRDIRPILSENCFHCHGPDGQSRQADLRLDTKSGALEGGSIIAGRRDESELWRRITSNDPDEVMPPPDSNRKLSPEEKERLGRWINDGARWSEHWAFLPIVRPVPPQIVGADRVVQNPIDAFVQKKLSDERRQPAPEADRARLLRRVTMDLAGLPPTIEELDAFLNDSQPNAYEKLVDRLLASPRYGERMVWDWLDAARYADTNGYQGDPTRAMWYWRDWAIAAFNANQPFDTFTIEQIAGDLLPNPTQDQLIATGFHRNHMINGEGGRIAEESRVDYVQDRVETTGTVWLGLTFNCCRCHDHKFDSITQKEYYQLAAYFNSIDESGANDARGLANPIISLATPKQQRQLAALKQHESEAAKSLAAAEQQIDVTLEQRIEAVQKSANLTGNVVKIAWHSLAPRSLTSRQGTMLSLQSEATISVGGSNPAQDQFSLLFPPPAETITAIKLEALPHATLPGGGPGRADNGNFVLTDISVEVYGRALEFEQVQADFSQSGHPASLSIDGDSRTGWAVLPQFGQPHQLIVLLKTPVKVPESEVLTIRLSFDSPHAQHVLGRFRLSYSDTPSEQIRGIPAAVAQVASKPFGEITADERKVLADFYRSTDPQIVSLRKAADDAKSRRESFERNLPRTMVMRDRQTPRETHILIRGAYDQYGEQVYHGTPAFLPPLPDGAAANRLSLANWLIDRQNPLTARVVVNRFWQTFFGVGLVKTADDFGVQGEKPSHPELLDWLAAEFIDSGWDIKHVHRLIVTSATYRQSSRVSPELFERDPENRLLARGPRYRWPSWMLRDQALAVSGLINESLGGPPVKGYQPEGIWEEATFGKIKYVQDHGPALYRRSLYQFWRRIVGPTFFFDVSSRQSCTVSVARTNTPLQALVTLNDITYMEAARKLGERVLCDGGDSDRSRLEYAFRLVLMRSPEDNEVAVLLPRIAKLKAVFAADATAAQELIQIGEAVVETSIPPVELAVWTTVGSILLNLDETLSKE